MYEMNITSAKYNQDVAGNNSSISCTIDGKELCVPLAPGNRHFDEIMKQVEAGTLTIVDAD